jgi:hypothetical protein
MFEAGVCSCALLWGRKMNWMDQTSLVLIYQGTPTVGIGGTAWIYYNYL